MYFMDPLKKNKKQDKDNDKLVPMPDEETLHTTDPQEYMKGPLSSRMHSISEEAKKNDKTSKEEATKKRDDKL